MKCTNLRYWSAAIWYWSMTSSTGGSPGWGANPCLGFMSPSHTESGAPLLKAPALFTQCPTRRISLENGKLVVQILLDTDDESKVDAWRYESEKVWLPSSPGLHDVA